MIVEKKYSAILSVPLPICVINQQGKVIDVSQKINEVFLYDEILENDIFVLTGIKMSELYYAMDNGTYPLIRRNEKIFKVMPKTSEDLDEGSLVVFFYDVTSLEDLKERYNSEKPCVAKVQIDNYDEIFGGTGVSTNPVLSGEIDSLIRRWAERMNGSVCRAKNHAYMVWFEQQNLERLAASKFEILDEIRQLETGADFPASLSIGVGVGGKTLAQTEEYADNALDLALGRGGDQAVIKRKIKIEYYGGKLQTVEKSNKGKSRIVGHALKQLMEQSKKILIMGHVNPDMDSFGAALGISRLCALSDKIPYIVIDQINEGLQGIYQNAKECELYHFISSEKAESIVDEESLIIVVDTHRPSLVQCPALLKKTEKIIVIDHHRKMEEFIENPVLAYMESYASSTSELVAEILQYMIAKKGLYKLEAEALLAGMIVDTNGFAVKTGVRTFEAAAWLRRQGADPTEVKRFFQEEHSNIKIKAEAIAKATISDEGIAITSIDGVYSDAQLFCAQIADQLLTIKGVKVAFALGQNKEEETVISARSLGQINVQVIMETLGGGGHLTTAAAQVKSGIEETKSKIIEKMEEIGNVSHFK